MTHTSLASLLILSLAACGAGGASSGDDDDGPAPDAPGPSSLDPADCTPIAQNFVAAAQACGTELPPGAQAQLESTCRRGLAAAGTCGGDPARGFACMVSPDPTDWVCAGSEPLPSCDGDLAASLGIYCVMALGNPACASGIACELDADCSAGLSCNEATGQCFDETAYCVGLPCQFDADCPQGHTCNGAEGACIAE